MSDRRRRDRMVFGVTTTYATQCLSPEMSVC